jgi:hypothetical protein
MSLFRRTSLFFLVSLACSHVFAASQQPQPEKEPNYIARRWAWVSPKDGCVEMYHYKDDGTGDVSSNEEYITFKYKLATSPNPQGFFPMNTEIVSDNGKIDCMGIVDNEHGIKLVTYINFKPNGEQLVICYDNNFQQCFGTLKRVLLQQTPSN